jgi:Integrase DNA binding domain
VLECVRVHQQSGGHQLLDAGRGHACIMPSPKAT